MRILGIYVPYLAVWEDFSIVLIQFVQASSILGSHVAVTRRKYADVAV